MDGRICLSGIGLGRTPLGGTHGTPEAQGIFQAAKSAWEFTKPAREASTLAQRGIDAFDRAVLRAMSGIASLSPDDDLNKPCAIVKVMSGDAGRTRMKFGACAPKKKRAEKLHTAMADYGMNSFPVRQPRAAAGRMEEDIRKLEAYRKLADACPALALVIIGKSIIRPTNALESLANVLRTDVIPTTKIVAEEIFMDCAAMKANAEDGLKILRKVTAVVREDMRNLARGAPDS